MRGFDYLRDPRAIYRESFAIIRREADVDRLPEAVRPLAVRLAHACGDVEVIDALRWSPDAVTAGRDALAGGAPILVDTEMVAHGIIRRLLSGNPVVCTLNDRGVAEDASMKGTTRSAAAVDRWREHLDGAVVAIGNAPTALFRLLECLEEGAHRPALVLGFPVGFVGAAESKEALIATAPCPYIAVTGRRGGSALAAAAVNALAAPEDTA